MDDVANEQPMDGNNTAPQQEKQDIIPRGEPEIPEQRKKLVQKWQREVRLDKKHWHKAFQQMRFDQDFCWGLQWSLKDDDDRYVANVTLRHVQQRTAALYAKNPKAIAERKERMMSTVWDGTYTAVQNAMMQVQQALMMSAQGGVPPNPQALQEPMQILQDAEQTAAYNTMIDKFGKTLELLYQYNIDEQVHPFKTMMKLVVRRALTTAVGYVKLGYQRVLEPRPEIEARIADLSQRMATLERLAADIADGEITDPNAPEREQLHLMMKQLQEEQDAIVREGLVFDYPDSCSIIPDRKTRQLREFLGSDYVTQEYVLEPEEVKEIYKVDVGKNYTAYRQGTTDDPTVSPVTPNQDTGTGGMHTDPGTKPYVIDSHDNRTSKCVVWEIYSRKDGLVYVVADGYKDFLKEPGPPDVWMERFYPWFPLVLNESDHPSRIYPPSDVKLIRHQQLEYNRLREGLREHRIANRPKTAVAAGVLSESDVEILQTHPANAVLELSGLQPGQSVEQLLQAIKLPGVDPNLYEVNGVFEDILRTVGAQEANFGSAAGGTATETSIAESSRMSSLQSNVDDLDEMLTQVARAAGQILMSETHAETVKTIIGPGAVWPELSREELAKEVYLEIEAGSTGRPNQASEIQNYERLAPLLMQIPGVSSEMMAKEGIRRMDDKIKLEDVFDQNAMSITAINQMMGAVGMAGPEDPAGQGNEGAQNASSPNGPEGAPAGPDIPQPGPPVQ